MGTGWFFNRDKAGLRIFRCRDETLEESDNLPDPDVLAQEIVEDLEAALEQFREIVKDLGEENLAPNRVAISGAAIAILVIFQPATGSRPIAPGLP